MGRIDLMSSDRPILATAAMTLLLIAGAIGAQQAAAARVDSVYAAEVDLPPGSNNLNPAFDAALEQVLVKVSGLDTLGTPAARRSLAPDSAGLVRQYSRLPGDRIRVEFDGNELRTLLDAASQPVWGEERPLLALWYAVDAGGGDRLILAGESAPGTARSGADAQDALRERLLTAADARGLPLILPLVDAEDLSRLGFADIWGDFREPVLAASERYGAEGILIGRARSLDPDDRRVRWTLETAADQFAWEGSVEDGPQQAARLLAQRYATYADASGAVSLAVAGIDGLDRFGQLQQYLRSLNIVDSAAVARVQDDVVEFRLVVRGDAERLSRSLAGNRLLEPATATLLSDGRPPDLSYRWSAD